MAVAINGTPTEIDSSAQSGSQSISVPSSSTGVFCAVVAYGSGTWNASDLSGFPPTFGGVSLVCPNNGGDQNTGDMTGAFFFNATALTGSQTFAWNWGNAIGATGYGAKMIVGFVSGSASSSPVSSSNGAQQSGLPRPSGAVTGVASGLTIAWAWEYNGNSAAGAPTWSAVTDYADYLGAGGGGAQGIQAVGGTLATSSATGSISPSVTAGTNWEDGGCIALVIAPTAGGGGTLTALPGAYAVTASIATTAYAIHSGLPQDYSRFPKFLLQRTTP